MSTEWCCVVFLNGNFWGTKFVPILFRNVVIANKMKQRPQNIPIKQFETTKTMTQSHQRTQINQ